MKPTIRKYGYRAWQVKVPTSSNRPGEGEYLDWYGDGETHEDALEIVREWYYERILSRDDVYHEAGP